MKERESKVRNYGMNQNQCKAIPKLLGRLITALSIGYLIWIFLGLSSQWNALAFQSYSIHSFVFLAILGGIVYFSACFVLVLSWSLMVNAFGEMQVSKRDAYRIIGKTLLAKYLPGNILHLAGRHYLGKVFGLTHGQLLAAAILETLMLVIGAIVFVSMALCILITVYGDYTEYSWVLFFWVVTSIVVVFVVLLNRFNPRYLATIAQYVNLKTFKLEPQLRVKLPLIIAFTGYILFFLVSSVLFSYFIFQQDVSIAQSASIVLTIMGGFTAAWVIGYLVPGSPGGLGVREATVIVLVSPVVPEAILIYALFMHRLISIIGEIMLFVGAYWVEGSKAKALPSNSSDF